jgi:hypothetical protein
VAQQLADSAEPGDETAIATLLQAADALGTTDPATAAELAGRALELAPVRHPLRGPLVARRAISLFAAGLGEEGRRFADTALRQVLPAEEEARVRFSVASMFDISPDLRADNARAALALPDLTADLRASLWASLFHNLVVAGRTDEALAIEGKAREAVYSSRDHACWFAFELPESAVHYQMYGFGRGLEILQTAERRGLGGQEDARVRLAHNFRSWLLAAVDRYEEALHAIDEGVAAAQRDRQNWALRVFETSRGRQMLQMGQLGEAAVALEGRYSRDEAHLVVGVLEAPSVVALGKLKIHAGDERGAAQVAEIARIMLQASAPGVQSHAAWYLALHAMSLGKAGEAHDWLCAGGHDNRLKLFPLFPFEIADDPQLRGSRSPPATKSSPGTPSSKQSIAANSTPASSPSKQQRRTPGDCGGAPPTTCRPQRRFSRPGHARWPPRRHSKTSAACKRPRAPPMTRSPRSTGPSRSTRRPVPAGTRRGSVAGSDSWVYGGGSSSRSVLPPAGRL